jgi:hypothetical protein
MRWQEIVSDFEEHLFGLEKARSSISINGTAYGISAGFTVTN